MFLFVLSALAGGCSREPEGQPAVDESTYVELMTKLVLLRDSMRTINLPYWSQQQVLDSVEASIVEEYGVEADDLFEFARVAGRDPERMQRLWKAIQQRADSIRPPPESETDEDGRGAAARRQGG